MAPVQPPDWDTLAACAEGAIGLNLSSLLAPFATRGDMPAWVELCATIVLAVLRTCRRQVLLVPHVTVPESDDHAFLMRVAERVRAAGLTDDAVRVLPAAYSAAELKFVISRLAVFVGARMHATIAALSSSVPTIGLTYSIKTVGVFRDFYGTDGYCIAADATTAETVAARVGRLMIDGPRIREQFLGRQVEWRQRALKAAEIVRTRLAVPGTTNGGNR
jgi:polysaccharide pyruvyl transferase WcaK-like protein